VCPQLRGRESVRVLEIGGFCYAVMARALHL
jgi:hypothetical protein